MTPPTASPGRRLRDAWQKEAVADTEGKAEDLLALIEDILEIARIGQILLGRIRTLRQIRQADLDPGGL